MHVQFLMSDIPGGEPFEVAGGQDVNQRVDELSGRQGACSFLRQLRRDGDRVFIASNRSGERNGRGFVVEYAAE